MNHMLYNSKNAPWNTPNWEYRCHVCGGKRIIVREPEALCRDCGQRDYTEYFHIYEY